MNSTSPALPEEATLISTASSAKTRIRVEGMDCASCATKIENALQRMPGVTKVAVSVAGGTVTVSHDAGRVGDEKHRHRILDLGYRAPSRSRRETIPLVTVREFHHRSLEVRKVPILLQKSFGVTDENFQGR